VISAPQEWSPPYWDDEHAQYAHDLLFAADVLLLGRQTYEGFAEAWPGREGEYSDRINAMPKYVASRTLEDATWNATILDADVAEAVERMKEQSGENILKFGTGELDKTLLDHKLVDEYHLWLFPEIVGSGERLFEGVRGSLSLRGQTTFKSGIVVLRYGPKE
jgi:dihydrofolate reductase